MQENYVFVVVPSKVARSTDAATPLELDQSGNLVKSTAGAIEELKLQIPFSLKNLKMLCEYPLKGKENTPVFHKDSYAPVFDQCGLCSDKVRIFFMRNALQTKVEIYPIPTRGKNERATIRSDAYTPQSSL